MRVQRAREVTRIAPASYRCSVNNPVRKRLTGHGAARRDVPVWPGGGKGSLTARVHLRRNFPMPISYLPFITSFSLLALPFLCLAIGRRAFLVGASVSIGIIALLMLWVYVPGWVL